MKLNDVVEFIQCEYIDEDEFRAECSYATAFELNVYFDNKEDNHHITIPLPTTRRQFADALQTLAQQIVTGVK